MTAFNANDVIDLGRDILQAGPICDECLGRVASKLGRGLTNAARGAQIRSLFEADDIHSKPGTCWVCGNLFDRIDEWVRQAVD
ncbi:MAG: tRNA pseudouridine(54/55) synthase Pus10, partial [Candidatus Atribacteria bacterium]